MCLQFIIYFDRRYSLMAINFFNRRKFNSPKDDQQRILSGRINKLKKVSKFSKLSPSVLSSRIIVGLDHSGSMCDLYFDGSLQEILNRIYPLSCMSNNQEILEYAFTDKIRKVSKVDNENFYSCLETIHFFGWGRTVLTPFFSLLEKKYLNDDNPTLVISLLDEDPEDVFESLDIIEKFEKENENFFFMFVSIRGYVPYLKDNLVFNNSHVVSFNSPKEIISLNDISFYKIFIEPYLEWYHKK